MVKRLIPIWIIFFLLINLLSIKPIHAESFNEIILDLPNEDIGEFITTRGGYKLIEFWHFSGGYWEATTRNDNGIHKIRIYDHEADGFNWADPNFLLQKIYENGFVLEYKIEHPQEVIDAIKYGKTIIPVISMDKGTVRTYSNVIVPYNFFNYEPLPEGLPSHLPEKPEYLLTDTELIIRALPRLSCLNELLQDRLDFHYPYKIPLIQTGFGSLGYSLYYHSGSQAGTRAGDGYSPDPYYGDRYLIEYEDIINIQGRFAPGFLITTNSNPEKIENSEELQIGYGTFANAGAVSIRFWYPIRIDYYAKGDAVVTPTVSPSPVPTPAGEPTPTPASGTTDTAENEETHNHNSMDSGGLCVIKADDRGNEQFDVSQGIPVRESLYINLKTKEYLYDSAFKNHTCAESETVRVRKTYTLSWREDMGRYKTEYCGSGILYHGHGTYCTDTDGDGINDSCPGHPYTGCVDTDNDGLYDYCPGHKVWEPNWVDRTETRVVYSEPYTINREYSYWTLDHLEVFMPDTATINNEVLPDGSAVIMPEGISKPVIQLSAEPDISIHVLNNPFYDAKTNGNLKYDSSINAYVVDLGKGSIDGGNSKPSLPAITGYQSIAEASVSMYHVKNDTLVFNGKNILNGSVSVSGTAEDPGQIPEAFLCGKDAYYIKNLTIPDQVSNGRHNSSGMVNYVRLPESFGETHDTTIIHLLESINPVTVHTPVVCISGVLNDLQNNQELNPDTTRASVILGRPSGFQLLTEGKHLDIPGYNNAASKTMDCRKYIKERQVKFPFDVYMTITEPASFVPKNVWYSIPLDKSYDQMDIVVPEWVPEGDYEVEFRELAVNAPSGTLKTERLANMDNQNYAAISTVPVRVIGRIYGFKITDVADTLWWDVFRAGEDSSEHTGNYYYVGTKDEDGTERGIPPLFTLPLMEGSHVFYKNRGVLKTGYTFRFELQTIGDYSDDDDHINIIPEFYYVKKDGTERQKADLWYHDDFGGNMNYFVKIDPEDARNRSNKQTMKLGDIYRNVPPEEITDTAGILGISSNLLMNRNADIGWFDRIKLSLNQRTFIGPKDMLSQGVDVNTALTSMQKWYGEYHLPNDLFAVLPGFDVPEYGRTHNGLTGKESFWLKDGYIIVNFRIETVKDGYFNNPVLSYWAAPCCNMFEREGFSYNKTDSNGASFELQDGDIVFYDTNKRSSDDYRTGGTH